MEGNETEQLKKKEIDEGTCGRWNTGRRMWGTGRKILEKGRNTKDTK